MTERISVSALLIIAGFFLLWLVYTGKTHRLMAMYNATRGLYDAAPEVVGQ